MYCHVIVLELQFYTIKHNISKIKHSYLALCGLLYENWHTEDKLI